MAQQPLRAAIEAYFASGPPDAKWVIEPDRHGSQPWIEVTNVHTSLPQQGWKLHVSATAESATAVLACSLPVLAMEGATFKVAASLMQIELLNQGHGGSSQVGKFLTVYPADDPHALRLAQALDRATRGLAGPRIPSDRQLRPGSLVHYRYGAFESRWLQTAVGEILPALEAPDGTLVPDTRRPMYRQPEWVTDPFVAAGMAFRPPVVDLIVAGRYLTVAVLNNSARTAVLLALDIQTGKRCVLKHARRAAAGGDDEAFVRIRREAEFLCHFAGDPHFPELHGLVEEGADLYLAMEHCEGPTIEHHVTAEAVHGRNVPVAQTVAWGRELAHVLDRIHRSGFVYGDVKPSNVIIAPDGGLRLLDFETVARCGGPPPEDDGIIGTLGFLSPQRIDGAFRSVCDDVYAFGALMAYLLTAADPSDAPDPMNVLGRALQLFNPAIPAGLEALVARCLEPELARRPPSMADVEAELGSCVDPVRTASRRVLEQATGSDWARRAAERLVTDLCSKVDMPADPPRRDVHDGAAGIVLTLAEAATLPGTEVRDALRAAAESLATSVPLPGGPLPGLYVGEAGVGAALLRAGVVLGDDGLLVAAADKGWLVAALPHASPDLYNGTAGRVRFHLALADVTGDAEHGRAALAGGDHLLTSVADVSTGEGLLWPIPAGYGQASGNSYLGYAHGSAGIGDVLLDLFETTGAERFAHAAGGIVCGLAARALPALSDGSGRDWESCDLGGRAGPFWCHGAAGVARFLLRAARLGVAPEGEQLALAAAKTTAEGARWAGPGQCHGLAGNAELLLDVFVATQDRSWLDAAFGLLRLVQPFVDSLGDSDRLPDGFSGGRAGILACLLRFMPVGQHPHVMDRMALGRRPEVALGWPGTLV